MPRDGICALDGIVETDWAAATFTMNWKLTRSNHVVSFRLNDPICMIIPVPRGFAEGFSPAIAPLLESPELKKNYEAWDRNRAQFLRSLHSQEPEAVRRGWEKDYFKGATANGEIAREHQTKIELKEFKPISE